jgi:hypothetical protein
MAVLARLIEILFILALCISSVAGQASLEETPEDQEYWIYTAAIEDLLLKGNPGGINISDRTSFPDFLDDLLSTHPPFSKEPSRLEEGVLESFGSRSDREYPLERGFNLSIPYALVDERSDPGATRIAGFSRVGFSPDGHQALLLLDYAAYWYVSEGTFVLLEKEDGVWRVKATELAYLGE